LGCAKISRGLHIQPTAGIITFRFFLIISISYVLIGGRKASSPLQGRAAALVVAASRVLAGIREKLSQALEGLLPTE